jgi:hypothetical protein
MTGAGIEGDAPRKRRQQAPLENGEAVLLNDLMKLRRY